MKIRTDRRQSENQFDHSLTNFRHVKVSDAKSGHCIKKE